MDLSRELIEHVAAFVAATLTLDELVDWLGANAEELGALDDPAARRLNGRVWALIGEYGYGHRSVASMRDELTRMLNAPPPHNAQGE